MTETMTAWWQDPYHYGDCPCGAPERHYAYEECIEWLKATLAAEKARGDRLQTELDRSMECIREETERSLNTTIANLLRGYSGELG